MLGFLMEAHVKLSQTNGTFFLDLGLNAPELVRRDQFTELRAPVAEMVDADAVISHEFIDLVERVAYHRRTQMADVERLRDIYRRVIDADVPACAFA
ncbi:hypothetical protein SDC9_195188 [bioreactor metagenome]|uniref:Uncharacterized protein n=1 Tax=bioreactor metagenome TaxID=1076179 RepID=A0A645I8B4_9ZZZZ